MASTVVYCTVNEIRAQIQKEKVDAPADVVLLALATAASRAIDGTCNRTLDGFVAGAAAARDYAGLGRPWLYLDEFVTVTKVESRWTPLADYESWPTADYLAAAGEPRRPDYNATPHHMLVANIGGSFTFFPNGSYRAWPGFPPDGDGGADRYRNLPTVRVTATWGYATTVPPVIKEATIVTAAQWYKRGQGAWADTIGNADTGQLMYMKEIDPAVKLMLFQARMIRKSI